ncbi:MAG: hypothetical protein GYA16_03155 [Spirochaetes bacterium]|nr:hypothetical protein [Spirochaetota bacterium]
MNNNTQNSIIQLKEELIPLIKTVVQDEVKSNIEEFMRQSELRAKELSLIERIIRVEEELKSLKEVEKARFEAIESRFESMGKRFTSLQWFIGIGFAIISILIAVFGLFIGKV